MAKKDQLKERYAAQFAKALRADPTAKKWFGRDPAGASDDELFEAVFNLDPTKDRRTKAYKYADWICGVYAQSLEAQNPIRAEDFYKITNHLSVYDKFCSRINERPSDIQKYSYEALVDISFRLKPEGKSRTQLNREQREKIEAETLTLYAGPEGKVVVPLTEAASCFWGQGTEWCTAATQSKNYFDDYFSYDPLVIFLTKDKDKAGRQVKFQYHRGGNLRDAADLLCDGIPSLLIALFRVLKNNFVNPYVELPREATDEEVLYHYYLNAVRQDYWALEFVPQKFCSEAM